MSGHRRRCRADELEIGTVVSVGSAYGSIAELRRTGQCIGVRIEGDGLWFTWRPDEDVYLEPAEHIYALQAERRR